MTRTTLRGSLMTVRLASLVVAAATLMACSEEDVPTGINPPGPAGRVRFVNAVSDAARADRVNVSVAGTPLGGAVVYGGAATGTTTTYAPTLVGTWPLAVRRTVDTTVKVLDYNVNVAAENTDYTVLAIGNAAGVAGVTLTDANAVPPAGNVKIRVVHASPAITGNVDVYVTTATQDISTLVPTFGGLAPRTASAYATLGVGTFRVRVTAAGTKTPLLRDVTLPALASLAVRTVVILDQLAPVTTGLVNLTDR
jgi:hypothetical protein